MHGERREERESASQGGGQHANGGGCCEVLAVCGVVWRTLRGDIRVPDGEIERSVSRDLEGSLHVPDFGVCRSGSQAIRVVPMGRSTNEEDRKGKDRGSRTRDYF